MDTLNNSISAKLRVARIVAELLQVLAVQGMVPSGFDFAATDHHALPAANDVLLSPERTARYLGLSSKTLANWRVQGRGPLFIKVGKRVQYLTGDVRGWQATQARNSTSEGGRHERA